ncbi:MAG: DUF4350 domain-containing protein [Burkholderiales bacterium]
MTRNRLISAVLCVLLAWAAYWFATRFARVTEREHVGFQGEALEDPLLAAGRVARKLGLPAQRLASTAQLQSVPADAVLVLADRRAMTPQFAERLLAWVERGGHLVTVGIPGDDDDPLLDALGIRREWAKGNLQTLYELQLAKGERPLRMQLRERTTRMRFSEKDPRAVFTVVDRAGMAWLLHTRVGGGAVTLLPGLGFATNGELGNFDHAEAFWQLVNLQSGRRALWTATRLETPSLTRWIGEHALGAAGVALVLLLFWLWRVVPRFGPVAPDPMPARRRLLDHLRAAGRFHWRREGSPGLLHAAREASLRRLARVHPDLAALTPTDRAREAAARTGLSADAARIAYELPAVDTREFTAAVSALQTFEERLNRRA